LILFWPYRSKRGPRLQAEPQVSIKSMARCQSLRFHRPESLSHSRYKLDGGFDLTYTVNVSKGRASRPVGRCTHPTSLTRSTGTKSMSCQKVEGSFTHCSLCRNGYETIHIKTTHNFRKPREIPRRMLFNIETRRGCKTTNETNPFTTPTHCLSNNEALLAKSV
jgi:hypothetical protein